MWPEQCSSSHDSSNYGIPQSSNVYDSLGEAYMDDGDRLLAIANYQKSLQINPKNGNAVAMLKKLNAPMR
jgi:tetratricopeptide (TPR) repeat protein